MSYSEGINYGVLDLDGGFSRVFRQDALGGTLYRRTGASTTAGGAGWGRSDSYASDTDQNQSLPVESTTGDSDVIICYNTSLPCNDGKHTPFTFPIVSRVKTWVDTGNSSYVPHSTVEQLDGFGNTTALMEYGDDYYSSYPGPFLLRQTLTSYTPNGPTSGEIPNAIEVQDGSGNRVAYTAYDYVPFGAYQKVSTIRRWVGPTGPTDQGEHFLVTNMTYDSNGNLSTTSSDGSPATTYTYDTYGFPYQVIRPQTATKHISTTNYDPYTGLLLSSIDENGQRTSYQYDNMGRLTEVDAPDGGVTRNTYSGASITTSTLLHGGSWSSVTSTADASGRVKTVQDGVSGAQVDYSYTSLGQPQTISNPHIPGQVSSTDGTSTYGYTGSGKLTSVLKTDTVNQVTTSTLSGVQNNTDERGNRSQRTYDAMGRMVQVVEPDSWITYYKYDLLDNVIEIDQTGGSPDIPDWHISRFEYDSLSRLVSQQSPEAGGKSFYYNDSDAPYALCSYNPSNVCGTQDDFANYAHMTYDVLGRLTNLFTPEEESLIYVYDAITMLDGTPATNAVGRMVKMQKDNTMREMSYDKSGRVTKILDVLPSDAFASPQRYSSIFATYDFAGAQTSLTYPDGRTVNYAFDANERLSEVSHQVGTGVATPLLSGFTYAPTGLVTGQTFGNGVAQTTSFNSRMQPIHKNFIKGSNTLYDKTLTWADGNGKNSGLIWAIQDAVDPSQSTKYNYDAENRLTSASTPDWSANYGYDPFGNQTQTGTWTYLDSFDTHNHPYPQVMDILGNIHTAPAMTFSADNLIQTIGEDSDILYTYDAANMRSNVSNQYDHTFRETLYLGNILLASRSSASRGWTDNIYANGQRIAVIDPAGNTRYHITDEVGSMAVSSDAAGNFLGKTELTPFGRKIGNTTGTNLLFSGKERDDETGLDYFGGRYYSSNLGRFISPDPTGFASVDVSNPQSLNLYHYALNNPLTDTDPTGFDTCYNSRGNVLELDQATCAVYGQEFGATWIADVLPNPDNVQWRSTLIVPSEYNTDLLPSAIYGGFDPNTGQQIPNLPAPDKTLPVPVHGPWHYGNFCGAGGMGVPINAVDRGCEVHDSCFGGTGADWTNMQSDANWNLLNSGQQKAVQGCNQQLCRQEQEAAYDIPWWNWQENIANMEIRQYFHSFVPKGARCE